MKLKKLTVFLLSLVLCASCCAAPAESAPIETRILLSDEGILVNGEAAGNDPDGAVYAANDIVYYEADRDFTYGAGTQKDAHSADEAAAHTVVHITEPGSYSISGKLSRGQIAVDLGDGAKKDPEAVVTLILNGAEIRCDVAPAIIFYNVYECGGKDEESATRDVDTSAAGANIILADGTENIVSGSYVADIYDPDSLEIEDGEVKDAKKLHSYDGALYSRRSMNIGGSGSLEIIAENEGLCSELHLTVNGGNIRIFSGNDGINANEDNLSVVTVNGGKLQIQVTGETGEGDGIDSNGWIVINGGEVRSFACGKSADAGIDADKGIHILGGEVVSGGNMLDRVEDGGQNYAVFTFAQTRKAGEAITLKGENGFSAEMIPRNDFSILIYSAPDLSEGIYTLWAGDAQLEGTGGMAMGGGRMFGGRGMEPPEDMREFDFSKIPGMKNRPEPPEGMPEAEMPGSRKFGRSFDGSMADAELSEKFEIKTGANQFGAIAPME